MRPRSQLYSGDSHHSKWRRTCQKQSCSLAEKTWLKFVGYCIKTLQNVEDKSKVPLIRLYEFSFAKIYERLFNNLVFHDQREVRTCTLVRF